MNACTLEPEIVEMRNDYKELSELSDIRPSKNKNVNVAKLGSAKKIQQECSRKGVNERERERPGQGRVVTASYP